MTGTDSLPQPTLDAVRHARAEFQAGIEPPRPKLFAYCRRLTGDVWDAEDLVQETLARAFSHAAQTFRPVEKPMAWLVRIATNAYLDERRRRTPVPVDLADRAAPDRADPMEVRDALTETADGGVARMRWYYFCPEVLTEIAGRLGAPLRTHGYDN